MAQLEADVRWTIAFVHLPDGAWICQVYDRADELCSLGIGEDWEDALLGAVENLRPY